jgi:hypothetical protein
MKFSYSLQSTQQISRWYSVLIVLQLSGFAVVSFWPSYLGVEGRMVTVPYRAMLLVVCAWCCLLVLRHGLPRHTNSPVSLMGSGLWLAYSIRGCWQLTMHPWVSIERGMPETWEFAFYLFLCTIPAFFSAYLVDDIRIYNPALKYVQLFCIAGCLMALQYHWVDLTTHTAESRMQGNDLLGPIQFGHLGVTTAVLGIFSLVRGGHKFRGMYGMMAIIALPLGVVTVLMAASRAPLIALVVLLPLTIFFASYGRGLKLTGWAVVLGAIALFAIPLLVQQVMSRGVDLYTYFGSVEAFTSSESSLNRAQLMRDAWHAFEAHPFFGAGLFETYLHTYPHNVVLEALMATGVFGGTMMTGLVIVSLIKSFRLMHNFPEMSWIPILYLQYLIHLMVSGALYFDPTAFALMGAVLAAAPSPRKVALPAKLAAMRIGRQGNKHLANTACPQPVA